MLKTRILILILIVNAFVLNAVAQVPLFIDSLDVLNDTTSKVKNVQGKVKSLVSPAKQSHHNKIDSLIAYANTYLGDRYKRGGAKGGGFDCSGFTMVVFNKMGIKLPHTSAGQGLMGVQVNRQNIQKGDLVLFKGRSRRSSRIGHVGIVISEKGEPVKFIHSSTSQGVRVDEIQAPYYKNRFVKAVRITELYK